MWSDQIDTWCYNVTKGGLQLEGSGIEFASRGGGGTDGKLSG